MKRHDISSNNLALRQVGATGTPPVYVSGLYITDENGNRITTEGGNKVTATIIKGPDFGNQVS